MSSYRFNTSEKWAIWKTHGPNCRWCREPVSYYSCQLDHVIPESISTSEFNKLKKIFDLNVDFEINSFYNWIPIHSGCNQSKKDDIFDGAPFVGQLLKRIGAKYSVALNHYTKMAKQPQSAILIASLERGLEEGIISEEEINHILLDAKVPEDPVQGLIESFIQHNFFILPEEEGWQIIKKENGQNHVIKDGRFGIAPSSKTPDLSWLCGHCKHFGPWDGNRCLTCGRMSYPD